MILPIDKAEQIVHGDHEDWCKVEDTECITGQRRWTTEKEAIFLHKPTNTTYLLWWNKGSTECQEDTDMWCGDTEVELSQVVEKEVLVKQWIPVENDMGITHG